MKNSQKTYSWRGFNTPAALRRGWLIEAWLRHGKGEMYVKKPVEDEERLLLMFRRLSYEMRVFVLKKIEEFLVIDEEKWGKEVKDVEEKD
jgi:hypothetical protein